MERNVRRINENRAVVRMTSHGQTDMINHPPHYCVGPGPEVIEITEHMNFCLGNVVKYVCRCDHKDSPIEDLKKARWYLDREIVRREKASKEREAIC